jgi:hypothetical protein
MRSDGRTRITVHAGMSERGACDTAGIPRSTFRTTAIRVLTGDQYALALDRRELDRLTPPMVRAAFMKSLPSLVFSFALLMHMSFAGETLKFEALAVTGKTNKNATVTLEGRIQAKVIHDDGVTRVRVIEAVVKW